MATSPESSTPLVDVYAAMREGQYQSMAYLNVDRMARLNMAYTYHVGDAFLLELSQLLAAGFGEDSLLIKTVKDEFAVLCNRPLPELIQYAERVVSLCSSCSWLAMADKMTVSIGVVSVGAEPVDVAFRLAKEAMVRAKKSGRNRVSE